jgi:Lon protease-like protein
VRELGLFPLAVVLLPGERIPLHIFEPRYLELIRECLATNGEFGLVYAGDDGVRDVGTAAHVVEVLEELPDGRLNIVVEGRERFRVHEVSDGRSFATAVVDAVTDDGPAADAAADERARELFRRLCAESGLDLGEPASGSFGIASLLDFAADTKQELLELRSEHERTRRLIALLESGVRNLGIAKRRAELASRNGRLLPDT